MMTYEHYKHNTTFDTTDLYFDYLLKLKPLELICTQVACIIGIILSRSLSQYRKYLAAVRFQMLGGQNAIFNF